MPKPKRAQTRIRQNASGQLRLLSSKPRQAKIKQAASGRLSTQAPEPFSDFLRRRAGERISMRPSPLTSPISNVQSLQNQASLLRRPGMQLSLGDPKYYSLL